jgi:hypothetical protein
MSFQPSAVRRPLGHIGLLLVFSISVVLNACGQSTATGPSTPSGSLAVSAYTKLTDPIEQAFSVEVPSGWQSEAGMARRAALQIDPYVRSLSPDKMTYLMLGDPSLPSFTPPSQMLNRIGLPEGKLYNAGLGGLQLVLRYTPGAQFAQLYGQTALQSVCPSLKFVSMQDRPDLAQRGNTQWPTPIPSRSDGGEARFTCTHNKQPMEVRVEAATRITNDAVGWNVIVLQAFIAPQGQGDAAEQILSHMAMGTVFSPAWVQKQNSLSQQAAMAINQQMQTFFQNERSFIGQLNSVDQSFESMDEIVSGFSSYRDNSTGSTYSLSNTNPYKWIDPGTGRIISTATNNAPSWAPAYVPLAHVSQ